MTGGDEREILDWLLRALRDNHPEARFRVLGTTQSSRPTRFKKLGMPIEEAVRRAMDGNPHLVTMAKLLLADMRRNAPDKPVPADEAAAAQAPGDILHNQAQALTDKHPHLSYSAALHQVLDENPALRTSYART